jgi:hypothetical protein
VITPYRYCGRDFTAADIVAMRHLIEAHPDAHRARLSRLVCEHLGWRRVDGRLKDMSCRVAMLRMQDDGLLVLPTPLCGNANGKRYGRRTPAAEPELLPLTTPAGQHEGLHLDPVTGGGDASHLWNEYVDRYHYLGYHPLPGAQMRYFARRGDGQVLALLGFGAAAWKAAPRDDFIGWTPPQRKARLHLVANNARFLILPWVCSRNLASTLLAMASRQLSGDWERRYGHPLVLLETFVELPRFRGTCYKAANWLQVGETKGRGKLDRHHEANLPRKSIWLYPLTRDFRSHLCH